MTKFLCNIKDVQRLNEFTEKNFWKANYDEAELNILGKCNRRCILSCGTFFLFILAIDVHYIFIPFLGKFYSPYLD